MCVAVRSRTHRVLFLSRRQRLFSSDPSSQKLCQVLKKSLKKHKCGFVDLLFFKRKVKCKVLLVSWFLCLQVLFFLKSEGLNTSIITIKTEDLML